MPNGEPVHSAAYWNDILLGLYGAGTFRANEAGIASPSTRTWNWTGAGEPTQQSEGNLLRGESEVEVEVHLGADAQDVEGQSSTLELTVEDAADSLSDEYTVNWHMPYENWHRYAEDDQLWHHPPLDVDAPGYARNNEAIQFRWNYEKAFLSAAAGASGAAGAALAGILTNHPLFVAFWATVGIAASEVGRVETDQTSANFDSCWDDSRSTWDVTPTSGLTGDALNSQQDDYRMVPVKILGYTISYLEADAYNSNGFAGIAHQAAEYYDGREATIGEFEYVANGGGTL